MSCGNTKTYLGFRSRLLAFVRLLQPLRAERLGARVALGQRGLLGVAGHVFGEVLPLEEPLAALAALVARLAAPLVHALHVPRQAVLALDVRVALIAPEKIYPSIKSGALFLL